MAEKWNEKWPKNANCEQPYYKLLVNCYKLRA